MFAFPLHSPVLEPDFDLPLGEVERVSDLNASLPRQVAIEVKLLLQLEALVSSVGRSRPFATSRTKDVVILRTCTNRSTNAHHHIHLFIIFHAL